MPDIKLVTTSDWVFKVAKGKKGKWRWQLYNPEGRHVAGCSVKGFGTADGALTDIHTMCDALDKKLLHSLFRRST